MNEMYSLLAKCQELLNNCELNRVDEMELEMYIFRLRRMLLFDIKEWNEDQIRTCRADIGKMYLQINKLCNLRGETNAEAEYEMRVNKLTEILKSLCS
jgi:hypothetical protein